MADWEDLLRKRSDGRPRIMGILNTTPDSFHASSRVSTEEAAAAGQMMIRDGADWLDIGGESTRPGAESVTSDEEIARIIGPIRDLSQVSAVSVDTRKAAVAREALASGAQMVNDVGGLRDPEMVELVLESRCAVCIMHMRGTPETMQHDTHYDDVIGEVAGNLIGRADNLVEQGHPAKRILLDPGIGFGKDDAGNLALLTAVDELRGHHEYGVLWGTSRKSFIGRICGRSDTSDRLAGTLATAMMARELGVDVVRVHDVAEHTDFWTLQEQWRDAKDLKSTSDEAAGA